MRMLVVHARGGGFHIALIPSDLGDDQVEAAILEFGIEGAAVLELGDLRTSEDNLAVAYMPFHVGELNRGFDFVSYRCSQAPS